MTAASFSDLKAKRTANSVFQTYPDQTKTRSSDEEDVTSLYPAINDSMIAMKRNGKRGRGLYAKRDIPAGTTLLKLEPHVALLDKIHMSVLCSHCMMQSQVVKTLRRCSACKVTYYCSQECQRAQWKPHLHKLECPKLQEYAKAVKAMGRPSSDYVPDTPIRALGNLMMLKAYKDATWWQQVVEMAGSPQPLTPPEQEQLGMLTMAYSHYIGGTAAVQELFQDLDSSQITKLLLSIADKFGINSFSLTAPDLTNVGVAICPTAALINHSCYPNCATVYPEGPSKGLAVVAFRSISKGEEILASYVDLTSAHQLRNEDLSKQYKFECECKVCEEERGAISKRSAFLCANNKCTGIVPMPRDLSGASVQLQCVKCGTQRKINLARGSGDDLGLRWALEQAKTQLSIQSPLAFNNTSQTKQLEFEMLWHQLTKIQRLHPASQPLLDISALGLDRALSPNVELFNTNRYGRAVQFSQQLLAGLDQVMPEGHPVRATQTVVLSRLLCIGPNGEELLDDQLLLRAMLFMRETVKYVRNAFGSKSILLERVSAELLELERDLEMRRRIQQR